MAKQQSFADKVKGKSAKPDFITVKCIISYKDEQTGTWKFRERFTKIKDIGEVEKLNFN